LQSIQIITSPYYWPYNHQLPGTSDSQKLIESIRKQQLKQMKQQKKQEQRDWQMFREQFQTNSQKRLHFIAIPL
jgi:hypothetical protein